MRPRPRWFCWGVCFAGFLTAENAFAEQAPPLEAKKTPPPEESPREQGVGIMGLELGTGQDLGTSPASAQGAQLGMRFPLHSKEVSLRMDAMLGGRPNHGVMGELRLQADTHAGPPARSGLVWGWWGMDLAMMQTPTVWHTLIEIPRGHLGVRSFGVRQGFELGARFGYAWIGRYNPTDATRPLGNSLTPALYGLAYTEHLYLSWDLRSLRSLENNRPVTTGELLLCGVQDEMAACVTGRYFHGHVRPDDGSSEHLASSWQLGLMLGIGERLGAPKE